LDVALHEGRWLPLPGAADDVSKLGRFESVADLQIGSTHGIVSARIAFNPLETLDLLLGFVGMDLVGDDASP
jgi:hypothetical protein